MNFQLLMDYELAGISIVPWSLIVVVVLMTLLILSGIKRFILKRIVALSAEHDELEWLNYIEAMFGKSKLFLYLAVGLFSGIAIFEVDDVLASKGMSLVQVLVILQLGVWATAAGGVLMRRLKARVEDDPAQMTALTAIKVVIDIAVWSLVILLALANLGFDISALIASLGIGGVAIALASQAVLGDLLAFFSIIVDKPFLKNDFIVVGNFSGTIEHIGIKTTRVRSLDGEQVIFSNQDLLQSRICNYKRMEDRRVVLSFGVTYQTSDEDIEAIPEIIAAVVESVASEETPVRFDRAHLKDFGESSLRFEVVYAVLSPNFGVHMDIRQAVLRGIFRKFRDRGIHIAYPTRTVELSEHDDRRFTPEAATSTAMATGA